MLILAGCGGDDEPSTTAGDTTPAATTGGTTVPPKVKPTAPTATAPGPAITAPTQTGSTGTSSTGAKTDAPRAVLLAAQAAWVKAKGQGQDLSAGPCIANPLGGYPDWVVDVAHKPRTAADDDPANQCSVYQSGEAHHFVELTPKGNLIRAQ